jgi:hypothetical protein
MMPPLGRFTSVDPVTASQESLSTYQYGWNNPVLRSDRNGDCPGCGQQLISWLIGGYYKYVQGGLDYARNEAHHNTRSEYTERVPQQTRNINYAIGKAKAIQTSVEGATQIVESHMTVMGALEGGAIGASSAVVRIGWKAVSSGPQVGRIANMIDDVLGKGTVKGVEAQVFKNGKIHGDLDIVTAEVNISVKTGRGNGSYSQAIKEAAIAKEQGKSYVFYATDKRFSTHAAKQMTGAGIPVVRNDRELLRYIKAAELKR